VLIFLCGEWRPTLLLPNGWMDEDATWYGGLKCATRGSLEMQNPKTRQKSPSRHHRTNLSGHILATKARIDNLKKNLLSSSICSAWLRSIR